jgi:hypothetical protein
MAWRVRIGSTTIKIDNHPDGLDSILGVAPGPTVFPASIGPVFHLCDSPFSFLNAVPGSGRCQPGEGGGGRRGAAMTGGMANGKPGLLVYGTSHELAPMEVREALMPDPQRLDDLYAALQKLDQVEELLVLNTCNRVEVYATGIPDQIEPLRSTLADQTKTKVETWKDVERCLVGREAVEHCSVWRQVWIHRWWGKPKYSARSRRRIRKRSIAM